jgi:beta-glucanase (GH16 family)
LVWSDEFDGAEIALSRWQHEVNCWGGGNGEDQCYVADAKNSFVRDGGLHIVALADRPSGAVGGPGDDPAVVTKGHSSARLRTLGQGDWRYGRVEVRARLPFGQGIWPAIWMLPTDGLYGGWAQSGEIDIMEAVNLDIGGDATNRVHGTLHYGGEWPHNVHSGEHYDPPTDVNDLMHTYAIEWEEGEIRWFVDEVHFATQTDWRSDGGEYPAPFDQRFHLILNLAVGGAWPGPPNETTTFPQELVVDYVRVYECAADPETGRGCGG